MQKNNAWLYSVFVICSVLGAVLMRLLSIVSDTYVFFHAAYSVLLGFGVLLIGVDSYKSSAFGCLLRQTNAFRLNVFAALVVAGLLVDFVSCAVYLYGYFSAGGGRLAAAMAGFNMVTAVGAAVYFGLMMLHFSGAPYAFEQLSFFHMLPLLWAMVKTAERLERTGADSLLRDAATVALLCFLYVFAIEAERKTTVQRQTVFLARISSYLNLMLFADALMLVLARKQLLFSADTAYSVTALTFCGFTFFLEKNMISPNTE